MLQEESIEREPSKDEFVKVPRGTHLKVHSEGLERPNVFKDAGACEGALARAIEGTFGSRPRRSQEAFAEDDPRWTHISPAEERRSKSTFAMAVWRGDASKSPYNYNYEEPQECSSMFCSR